MKVFLDDLSHLTKEQQRELNSILRSEYNRFQRKSYQKENNTPPMVSSKGKPITDYVHKFFSRYYYKINHLYFTLDMSNFEVGKSYQIVKDVEGFVSCYGDNTGNVSFYVKDGSLFAYISKPLLQFSADCTVVLTNNS